MRLPFRAEPLEQLRARYAAAVATTVDALAVERGIAPAPSGDRSHVFDCPSGLRLIVSVDRLTHGVTALHLSASADDDSDLYRRIATCRITVAQFCAAAIREWQGISGSTATPEFLGFTPAGIPHWLIERKD